MGDRSCAKEKSSGVENGSTRDAIDMYLTVIDSVLLAGIVLAVLSLLVKYHALAAFRKLSGPRPRPTASFCFLEMHGSFQAGPKVSKVLFAQDAHTNCVTFRTCITILVEMYGNIERFIIYYHKILRLIFVFKFRINIIQLKCCLLSSS